MRVAVYGAKHDAAMFEELLKGYCQLDPEHTLGNAMIDTACLGTPKAMQQSLNRFIASVPPSCAPAIRPCCAPLLMLLAE